MHNFHIPGKSGRPISADIQFPETSGKSPLIIFLHGFKGFKDWGQWPLMATQFTQEGFAVLRMNFSHNGTTPENLSDFVDLEAFGHNTFSKETQDVQDVVDWVFNEKSLHNRIDLNNLNIVAHSRGGAIAMVTAAEDSRIKKIATLSSVGNLQRVSDEEVTHWKQEGVIHVLNGRTNQNMPMYYSLVEDYLSTFPRFDLTDVAARVEQPFLVIHAEKDETVPLDEGLRLASLAKNAKLEVLPDANHSFGGGHPFTEKELPSDTLKALKLVSIFFK